MFAGISTRLEKGSEGMNISTLAVESVTGTRASDMYTGLFINALPFIASRMGNVIYLEFTSKKGF